MSEGPSTPPAPPGASPEVANGGAPVAGPDRPTPEFEVTGVDHVDRAVAPTLAFRISVTDPSNLPIFAMALSVMFTIEPGKRRYEAPERDRLIELFGEPERWSSTTGSFRWGQVDALTPAFTGAGDFVVKLPCTYDHDVAASKYFEGLDGGEAPLRLHFNGTVIYEAGDGRMQIVTIPWDCSSRFRMPVSAWKRMIEAHYPFRRWIALDPFVVERLAKRRAELGLPTFDAVVEGLLGEAGA